MLKDIRISKFFSVLKQIDKDTLIKADQIRPAQRIFITFMFVGLCLLFVHYAKYTNFFYWVVKTSFGLEGIQFNRWYFQAKQQPYFELISHAWWGLIHVLGYLVIPMLYIRFYLKESVLEHGLQWGTVHEHAKWYLLLVSPILCFVVIVSFGKDFSTHYPFYDLAHRSWLDLILWELIYISQFIALEFFFRGFILNSLKPAFGSNAILVMCLPYLMIHFPKLWPEAFGALTFGLFLGVLAMRSRSIWGGVGVHISIALAMDIAALLQTKGLPTQLTP